MYVYFFDHIHEYVNVLGIKEILQFQMDDMLYITKHLHEILLRVIDSNFAI